MIDRFFPGYPLRIWERRYTAVSPQRSPGGGRLFSAVAGTVHVSPVALSADNDLAMAAGAVIKTSAGFHRHNWPMRAG